jgi:hypothetical protein
MEAPRDITTTAFILPADAKLLPISELSPRLRARIGVSDEGQSVITRPGFRVITRLVPQPLAELLAEFHAPSLLTDAVLRFARTHDQDPFTVLELAFDALATVVESRILVPHDSPDASVPAPSLAAGQEFGGFEIDALIRSLEDSEVYRAHAATGELVALKIAAGGRPGVAAMLAHEARVLERLAGADTPRLVATGAARQRAYIAMEWCEGVSIAVAAQQARAARDRRRLHELVGRMLDAYARLHRCGVIHGDVHPGNCLVRDDGRVVLVDFGNARWIGSGVPFDPARAGIPQFHDPQMAAALLAGDLPPAATPESEQYAVAVLAYLLVTGLQAIDAPGVHDELLRRIAVRPALPFAARGVAGWPDVEAALQRGLAKAPHDRYPDVATLARAFVSARMPSTGAARLPDAARRAFQRAVRSVRSLTPCGDPVRQAWFALRAALALGDAELLAAADVLISRAEPDWPAQSVAALIARARSDPRMQRRAYASFVASVERLPDHAAAGQAVVAAATLLDGALAPSDEEAALADWASRRLAAGLSAAVSPAGDGRSVDPLLTYAALMLVKMHSPALRTDVIACLEALLDRVTGDVWLWALAHDVYADDRFRTRALTARRPKRPLTRTLAQLRLHQLTGEMRFVTAAAHALRNAPRADLPASDTALLVAELMAPELAALPPFDGPVGGDSRAGR